MTVPQFLWWREPSEDRPSQVDDPQKFLFQDLQQQDPIEDRSKSDQSTRATWGSTVSTDTSPSLSEAENTPGRNSLLLKIMERKSESSFDDGDGHLGHKSLSEHQENSASQEYASGGETDSALDPEGDKFQPIDLKKAPLMECGLPPELWTIIQSAPANFTPKYFLEVSRNLLENPNLTASHLSRAELSYTSFTDASFNPSAQHPHELASIVKHLKAEHQPLLIPGGAPGYSLEWTVVRKLIPRNPNLDDPLLQTCHLFTSTADVREYDERARSKIVKAERYLVVYLPHVSDPENIPFYHPKVRGLAILYTFQPNAPAGTPPGTLSIYYDLFPERPLDNRMSRTALKMLEIIHKHSRGRMAGYQKRVHHDVIIAQKPFQDTYAYLKGKYAKGLIEAWVEKTPAEKHVFEDLGIAAFLIELWTDMYGGKHVQEGVGSAQDLVEATIEKGELDELHAKTQRRAKAKNNFPGFVDIGCGNGILVWILNQEGWDGWGFDARRRKTWNTFGEKFGEKLKEMLLVPEVLKSETLDSAPALNSSDNSTHNGIFPTGTFIVANHADELTIWTPALAFLSESPFMAIPCCSHNFGGTRFRAPHRPQTSLSANDQASRPSKPPSAYASFCSYTAQFTSSMNYVPEKEYLRIPSTRNVAIIGRHKARNGDLMGNLDDKLEYVREIVEREMADTSIEQVRLQWLKRGSGLLKPGKGAGH